VFLWLDWRLWLRRYEVIPATRPELSKRTVPSDEVRIMVNYLSGTFDCVARICFHRGSIDVPPRMLGQQRMPQLSPKIPRKGDWRLATYIKRHPRDRFIIIDAGSLDHLQGEGLVVELEGEYSSRWRPRPDHQMMKHCGENSGIEKRCSAARQI
jgi:hypothetical protein